MNASRGKKAASAASAQSPIQPREQRLLHSIYWLLATAIFAADQLSKIVAQGRFSEGPVEILPILNFSLAYNRGAAFGAFSSGQMAALLLAVSMAATAAFAILLHRENRALPCLGWALMLGGALGNGLDRMLFGRVTDFIDFHFSGHHFPAFNIADASLTFGFFLMILTWYWRSDKKQAAKEPPSSSGRRKKKAPAESGAAVSEPAPQAGKEKKPTDQDHASEAGGRSGAQIQIGADLLQTSAEPPAELPAEGPPPSVEAAEAHPGAPAVEASENRPRASALVSKTAPTPFAPLAGVNLSRAFAAEPYSAGSQRQEGKT